MIVLRALGTVELRSSDGQELWGVLSQPKRLALLAWLTIERPRGFQSRDNARALFWPEHDDGRARRALNRAIYWLRQSVGEGVLLSRGDEAIGVAADCCWTDVEAFESAVANGRFVEAAELYRGDLLPGFFVSDAPGFERWLDAERQRLRSLAHRTGGALTEEEAAKGDFTSAAWWARWTLERSPYDESSLRRLLSILDAAGDRAGAAQEYDQFARRLEAELDLTPSTETQALIFAIRAKNNLMVPPGTRAATREAQNDRPVSDPHAEASAHSHDFDGGSRTGLGAAEAAASGTAGDRSAPATHAATKSPTRRARRKSRIAFAAAAVTVMLAAGSLVAGIIGRRASDAPPVLVQPFENRTGDSSFESLGQLTGDWIVQGLAEAGIAGTISSQPGNGHDGGRLGELIRRWDSAPARIVIRGAIYRTGRSLRLEANVTGPSKANKVWTLQSVAPVDSPEQGIREIRDRTTGASAALLNPRYASWLPLGTTTPPTFAAFKEFSRGDELVRSGRTPDALPFFQRASALDTTFTWSRLEMAFAYLNLLDYRRVDSMAASLDRQHDQLTPLELSWLDYMLATIREDRVLADRATAKAAELASDRFLHLRAETLRWLNRPAEIVELLRNGSGGRAGETRQASRITDAYHQLGEHHRELELAVRARRNKPVNSEGLWLEIRALAALGRTSKVIARLRAAQGLPRTNGVSTGWLMLRAAEELRAHGHREAATTVLERTIDWFHGMPREEAVKVNNRSDFATALYLAGQLDAAESIYQQLALEDSVFLPEYEGSLGAIAARRGDRATAEAFLSKLERARLSMNPPPKYPLFAQARIVTLLGDSERAVRLLREAVGGQGMDLHMDADFENLNSNPAFRDFMRPKG